jgi:hypothetical protein
MTILIILAVSSLANIALGCWTLYLLNEVSIWKTRALIANVGYFGKEEINRPMI